MASRRTMVAGRCGPLLACGLAGACLWAAEARAAARDGAGRPGVVLEEFIYDKAAFRQCHASTIAETADGLVAAWFGGTAEGHADVGIWLSRKVGGKWTAPVEVANGASPSGTRHPCWNPVLFQPKRGPLLLFFKVGPSPSRWWGEMMASPDAGKTWRDRRKLPDGGIGPVKNKPVQLADGTILCGSSTEHAGWRVHLELTAEQGKTWKRIGPLNDPRIGAIQPTIVTYRDGRMQILCRNRDGNGRIWQSWSRDGGRTWSKLKATALPNPNAGIDAVTLRDGRQLLVYNHTVRGGPFPQSRQMLNVAVSEDGKAWQAALVLEKARGEYSYPAVIQAADGRVHVTYTWQRRRVKHVVLDAAKLALRPIVNARWPTGHGETKSKKGSGMPRRKASSTRRAATQRAHRG
jgi:predicted neuraminidase